MPLHVWLIAIHLAGAALALAIVGLTAFLAVDYWRDTKKPRPNRTGAFFMSGGRS